MENRVECSLDTKFVSSQRDPATGAVVPPLHFATTYERDVNLEYSRGYVYSRMGNPTRTQFEQILTNLEGGSESFAFSSGMQAATSILMCCPGSHVLLPDDLYHGVHEIARQIFSLWGLTYEQLDMTNPSVVEERLNVAASTLAPNKIVVLWMETPSNPQCKLSDIQLLSDLARSIVGPERAISVVDATWSTPYLLSPLTLGADFVLHSITKYICGHSDVLGGSVTASKASASNSALAAATVLTRLRTVHQIGGGVLGPWESWMAMRGLRTLPVRMKHHCASAMQLAERLERHDRVTRVYYPGLASHPQYELAAVQYKDRFGGMMSILVKPANPKNGDGSKEALAVVQHVHHFKRATSLGGTESLIEHRTRRRAPVEFSEECVLCLGSAVLSGTSRNPTVMAPAPSVRTSQQHPSHHYYIHNPQTICAKTATDINPCCDDRRSVEGSHPVSPPNLLRISVGLEDVEDLYADISEALAASCR